jgi:hypothetical protein
VRYRAAERCFSACPFCSQFLPSKASTRSLVMLPSSMHLTAHVTGARETRDYLAFTSTPSGLLRGI